MMRGLVMDFNNDPEVYGVGDQYMLGPSLLVNPVYEYKATERKLYLPGESGWYDFYTGEYFKGRQWIITDAPLDRIPLFVKAGSIIPAGPELQYSSEKPADPVTLYVYTGANATFALYEDENVNYNDEQGAYSTIPLRYDESTRTLTIGERKGTYSGMIEERIFEIVWVHDQPAGIGFNAHPKQVVTYDGKEVRVTMKE